MSPFPEESSGILPEGQRPLVSQRCPPGGNNSPYSNGVAETEGLFLLEGKKRGYPYLEERGDAQKRVFLTSEKKKRIGGGGGGEVERVAPYRGQRVRERGLAKGERGGDLSIGGVQ